MISPYTAEEASEFLKIGADRRMFLKKILAGCSAGYLGTLSGSAPSAGAKSAGETSTVSFVSGFDRRDMIYQVLKPLEKEIKRGIKGKQVIIKANMVGSETYLCATHTDAIRGVLDFLKPIYDGTVLIGESTGRRYNGKSGTFRRFKLYDYFPLEREYKAQLVDLNERPYVTEWVVGKDGHPLDIRVIDSFHNPDNYFISLTRFKTHNCLVVTLSAKNMLLGAPINDGIRHEKGRMHSPGIPKMNFNVFLLAQKIQPDLAVLDGFEGMEGNGPTRGTMVEHGVAVAGTDFVATDRVACKLMGVDFGDVGYLTHCARAGMGQSDLERIKIVGENPWDHIRTYRLHENIERHLEWKNPVSL